MFLFKNKNLKKLMNLNSLKKIWGGTAHEF
jgi:hypothetical protein